MMLLTNNTALLANSKERLREGTQDGVDIKMLRERKKK